MTPSLFSETKNDSEALRIHRRAVYNPDVDDSPDQGADVISSAARQDLRIRMLTCLIHESASREYFLSAPSGNLNVSFEIECVRSEFVRPLNGRLPNNNSYRHTPSDHQSIVYV